jgi:hypothetical protein
MAAHAVAVKNLCDRTEEPELNGPAENALQDNNHPETLSSESFPLTHTLLFTSEHHSEAGTAQKFQLPTLDPATPVVPCLEQSKKLPHLPTTSAESKHSAKSEHLVIRPRDLLRRIYPNNLPEDLVGSTITEQLLNEIVEKLCDELANKSITPIEVADHQPNACGIEDLDDFGGLQLRNGIPRTADGRSKNQGDDNDSDSDSEAENEYLLMLRVRDQNPGVDWAPQEHCTLVDTGSPHNFIFPQGLTKLGRVKVHPLPKGRDGQLKSYESPINPDHQIVPRYFIRVIVWNARAGLNHEVDLKIFELPDDASSGGVDIILGRKFIRKHGGHMLLERVKEANAGDPRLAIATGNSISVLLKSNISKSTYQEIHSQKVNFANIGDAEQKLINKREDDRQRNQDRVTSMELYRKFKESSSGSSMGAQPTGTPTGSDTSERSHDASVGSSADSHASVQRPKALPSGPYFGGPPAQQIAQDHSDPWTDYPGEWQSRRSNTSNTSSTQFTQLSLNRQSTTSSMSSWASGPTDGGKLAGDTTDYADPQANPIPRKQ